MVEVVIAAIAVAGVAYFFLHKSRREAHLSNVDMPVVQERRVSVQQLNFIENSKRHPIDAIDDPVLAAGALSMALIAVSGEGSPQRTKAVEAALCTQFNVSMNKSHEIMSLGEWFVRNCQCPETAALRLARRLKKLDGTQYVEPSMEVMRLAIAVDGDLSTELRDLLPDIARLLGR